MKPVLACLVCAFLCFQVIFASATKPEIARPNVVFVITDDQGYPDFGFTGNPVLKTPTLDALRSESVLLDNYHVDPTCAPTRAALLTGRYSNRVGVWHTIQGRNMLRRREVTMADIFALNGYATGLFGKWHLGDCFPYRPQDRGFQQVVYHGAGGVGQAPDYWGNDYFDDTYFKNGKVERFEGFCTDVWFDEGMAFIREQARAGKPFFAYIAPNAPHGPYYCPEAYALPYQGHPDVPGPEFYGMIRNIDDNMARLMALLESEGISENTILVYTTDNGTPASMLGDRGYSAGMRGAKGSEYEGGHRVPFLLRWPAGQVGGGQAVHRLTAHLDILPTFIDLCGLSAPKIAFDGQSLVPLLGDPQADWPERTLIVESQRVVDPVKWKQSAVMTDTWRLINGRDLYAIGDDPAQQRPVQTQFPEVAQRLRAEYESFWDSVSAEHELISYMIIGSDQAPMVTLTSHDWLVESLPWNQAHVMVGAHAKPAHWAVEVAQDGVYEISLRRWPMELDLPINADNDGKGYDFHQARLRIGSVDTLMDIPAGAHEVSFSVELEAGVTELAPLFIGPNMRSTPFYVYVTHRPFEGWQTAEGQKLLRYDPDYGQRPPQRLEVFNSYYQGFLDTGH